MLLRIAQGQKKTPGLTMEAEYSGMRNSGLQQPLSREVTNNERKKNYHRNRNHPEIVSTILGDTEISDHHGRT